MLLEFTANAGPSQPILTLRHTAAQVMSGAAACYMPCSTAPGTATPKTLLTSTAGCFETGQLPVIRQQG
jgi:hypothetical protein